MKYFLGVNMAVFYKLAPEAGVEIAFVLDYIRGMCSSENEKIKEKRLTFKSSFWTWIDYTRLLKELPFLNTVKSVSSVSKAINFLKTTGFIEIKRWKNNKSYIKMTEKADILYFSSDNADSHLEFPAGNSRVSLGKLSIYNNSNSSNKLVIDKEIIDNIYLSFVENIHPGAKLRDKGKTKIITRLESFSEDELIQAIENFSNDEWWMKHNAKRGIPWFFHTDERIDQFLALEKTVDKTKGLRGRPLNLAN